MKSIIFLFAFVGLSIFAGAQVEVKSKIKNVIVYQQGAQINRQGSFSLKKGINQLVISGVSPQIDPNTLQINATGNLVILDSKHLIKYPQPNAENATSNEIPLKIKNEILRLQDSLFNLSYDQAAVKNKMEVLNSQKRIIENNGTIMGKGKVNDSIPLLRDALAFYFKEMNNINAALLKLNRESTQLAKVHNRMTSRLTELNNYNRNNQLKPEQSYDPIHEIVVTVSANETTSGKLNVSYLVNNAGWTPLYDLRSKGKNNSIDLTYKAQVYQNTGIDWENTRLNLSTNNPYTNKTKPSLNPWFLDYHTNNNYYQRTENAKKHRSIRSESATSPGNLYDAEGEMSGTKDKAMTAEQFMTTVEQLVSVEYAIDLPYTIKSDNQKNLVLIRTASLKANYSYYTVPKLDPSVYLIAQITDLDALNLIPGSATIFHEGSYLGTTYIQPNSLRDTMDLSLGKTNNITVKRQLIKNATKEKIVGDKIIKTFAYQIEVKNHNKQSVDLIVEDQIPVSRNPEIEIKVLEKSKAKLDEVNGFLMWKIKIKSAELRKFKMTYTVSYEKTKPINLAAH